MRTRKGNKSLQGGQADGDAGAAAGYQTINHIAFSTKHTPTTIKLGLPYLLLLGT